MSRNYLDRSGLKSDYKNLLKERERERFFFYLSIKSLSDSALKHDITGIVQFENALQGGATIGVGWS